MPLSNAAIRAIAIRRSAAKQGETPVAANDQAKPKRERLVLPDFTATLFASEIKTGETTEGKPYIAMKGCEMTLPGGAEVVRTVMAFDDACTAVVAEISAKRDVVATLARMGGVMKVVGLQVDGEMRAFERQLPKAG